MQESDGLFRVHGMEMYWQSRGDGLPLVLLHGFTGSSGDFQHLFPEPPDGFRLIEPDLRGHGRSTNPGGEFTFRQCAQDVLALLDSIGVESFRAIGLSGGGITLLHMATLQPERVERMVLVSAASFFPPSARALMKQLKEEDQSEEEWQTQRARHHHGDEQIRELWRHGREMAESYDDVNFTPPLLSTIQAHTLVVHGDQDPLYPLEQATGLFQAIPEASLWVLPQAGHLPVFGIRERFSEVVLPFLSPD